MTTEELARQLAEAFVREFIRRPNDEAVDRYAKMFDAVFTPILRPYIERLEKLEAALQHISDSVHTNDDPSAICCAHIADEALKGADHE